MPRFLAYFCSLASPSLLSPFSVSHLLHAAVGNEPLSVGAVPSRSCLYNQSPVPAISSLPAPLM